MEYNCFTKNPLMVFSEESVHKIHASVLSLLERVGVRVDSEEALGLLSDYGVRCDHENMRAYPDEDGIQRALGTVQKRYELYARNSRDKYGRS